MFVTTEAPRATLNAITLPDLYVALSHFNKSTLKKLEKMHDACAKSLVLNVTINKMPLGSRSDQRLAYDIVLK